MRRFGSTLGLLFIAAALQGSGPCHKKHERVPESGEILLSVVERESARSQELSDVGGVAKGTYRLDGEGSTSTHSQSRSFTGALPVPVRVKVDNHFLTLVELDVADGSAHRLALVSGTQLDSIKVAARQGVSLTVVVTRGGTPAPELRVRRNATPPPAGNPVTEYRPLTDVFADPTEILRATDLAATLAKLREVASATERYHRDLLKLVQDASAFDAAHLKLVLDGVYYPLAAYEQMLKLHRELSERNRPEDREAAARLAANIEIAGRYAPATHAILAAGLRKVSGLAYADTLALLRLAFPTGDADGAFDQAAEVLRPLSGAQKRELLDLALAKSATDAAARLAVSWFSADSDHRPATLIELATKFSWGTKDSLLVSAISSIDSLSVAEARALAAAAYERKEQVAASLIPKVASLDAAGVVSIATVVNWGERDRLLTQGLARLARFTSAELASIVGTSYEQKRALALAGLPRVSDLTAASVAGVIAAMLQWGDKDAVLLAYVASRSRMTVAEIITVARVAYEVKPRLLLQNFDRLTDFLVPTQALALARELQWGDRDTALTAFTTRSPSVTTADLRAAAGLAYERKRALLTGTLPKVSDLSGPNLHALASLLQWEERDALIQQGVDLLPALTPEELLSLVQLTSSAKAAVAQKAERLVTALTSRQLASILAAISEGRGTVALRYRTRISDLTAANAAQVVAAALQWGDKDTFLTAFIGARASLTTDEIVVLSPAAYEQKQAVLTNYLAKVSDFNTPANVLRVAALLNWDAKDTVLVAGLGRIASLASADLGRLGDASYAKKGEILRSGLAKASDLTVASAITLARKVNYEERDTVLLAAVPLVTDLSATNVTQLSDAGYAKKDEILRRGIERLAGR